MHLQETNLTKAAAYLRLSREDGDRMESDSITNQKELIRDYADNHSMNIVDTYVDDGYSGTSFDRPGFRRMMEDIESRRINCVIVKDLSRFGRNYIETGRSLEKLFPLKGIRFIAITDNYDSFGSSGDSDQILIPFKNLINDAYCRDISLKIRSQLDIKRKNGQFIGSFAGYGYRKDPKDKNHLIIDEDAAEIVRMIFSMKLEGYSPNRIADKLNEMKVVTPMEYKILSGLNYRSGFRSGKQPKWTAVAVLRILRNELYIGVTVQGKRQKINYKVHRCRDTDESEWVRVEGTHDAIIDKSIFDNVQEMLSRDTRTSPERKCVYLFSGYVRCPDCGQNMVRRTVTKNGRKYHYYHCSTYSSRKGCSSHNISEKALSNAVLTAVQKQVELLVRASELIAENDTSAVVRPGLRSVTKQIAALREEVSRYSKLMAKLYQDLQEGVVGEEEYKDISEAFSARLISAKSALEEMEKRRDAILSEEPSQNEWLEMFGSYRNIRKLDRKTVVSLIDHVDVHDKNNIEIHFRYEDMIYDLCEEIETGRSDESDTEEACV